MKKYLLKVVREEKKGIFPTFIIWILRVLSFLYLLLSEFYALLYNLNLKKINKLPRPVISVGNITTGGVGKTPFVVFLASSLKARNKKVVVLLRGYMDKRNNEVLSDEAEMLKLQLTDVDVLVGKNRFENAVNYLKTKNCDVFILDDGFQHRSLGRDLDIVLVDSLNPFDNRKLLPRGLLREPISSLKRANVFVLTKSDLATRADVVKIKKEIGQISDKKIYESSHHPAVLIDLKNGLNQLSLSEVNKKLICCFSSLGDNNSFYKTLERLGCHIQFRFQFIDHYLYNKNDIVNIINTCNLNNIDTIITTLKDYVKLKDFLGSFKNIRLLALKIDFTILENEDELIERISNIL